MFNMKKIKVWQLDRMLRLRQAYPVVLQNKLYCTLSPYGHMVYLVFIVHNWNIGEFRACFLFYKCIHVKQNQIGPHS